MAICKVVVTAKEQRVWILSRYIIKGTKQKWLCSSDFFPLFQTNFRDMLYIYGTHVSNPTCDGTANVL